MMGLNEILRAFVAAHLNIPYAWGGNNPFTGYDCSGLVQEWLLTAGIDPPGDQTAQRLYDHFSKLPREQRLIDVPHPGDLAFYGRAGAITHVAVVISRDFIFEAGGGGSSTRTTADAIRARAWTRIRPINHRSDLVAVVPVAYPGGLD